MAYLTPTEFVTKMIDAGEAKVFMSTKDTLMRLPSASTSILGNHWRVRFCSLSDFVCSTFWVLIC
jgi:hypothetical protein